MRFSAALLAFALAATPALATDYRAPVGSCDGATMMLEAARQAHLRASAAIQGNACTAEGRKALDAKIASATLLARRAQGALTACPGMDDSMWQGDQMARYAQSELADAGKSRAACGAP